MFRITQMMREVLDPTPTPMRRRSTGPVVIWNLIRRCNLACKHCYSLSGDRDYPGELTGTEIAETMDDLRRFGVPALILSGGEPLLRPDIFDISRRAKSLGFYVGLSSNGTLIDERMAGRVAEAGYDYVGISLDGIGATHDRFRRRQGAFDRALAGIRHCRDRGIKAGVRFTMTQDNCAELPLLLDLMEREEIGKFYLSHLNYAGRGNRNRGDDAAHGTARWAMDLLFQRCLDGLSAGREREYVTGNNDADGVYFLHWVERRFPARAAHARARLAEWGGNSSGCGVANIDNLGNVHPDTMWWHYSLGNVREWPFSVIWSDLTDPILKRLREHPRRIGGRCGECVHRDICNGNTRVRAFQLTGDPWREDPGCYLDDGEIGRAGGGKRLKLAPYAKPPRRGGGTVRAAVVAALAMLMAPFGVAWSQQPADAPRLFAEHCAECHGSDRLGRTGPALIPESLGRLRPADAIAAIVRGREQTQMPGFGDRLNRSEIEALAAHIRSPLAETPTWGVADMLRSHVVARAPESLPARPGYDADPLNLFVVVEAGDSHVTVLDGDRFEPIARFPSRFALHGGPKFTPDGRFVFFASRDGWVTKYDLYALDVVAEIRAGLNTRNIAISADGATVLVGNYLPHILVVLSAADLKPVKLIEAKDRAGKISSRVSAVYQAAPRNSFIVALKDAPELWEMSWLADPPPVFAGMVHSHEQGMTEGLAEKGRFPIRRIALSQPLDDFFFDPAYRNLLGSAREGGKAVVVNLDVGREIAEVPMPGLPHLGSGITWIRNGRPVMATPNLKQGAVSVIDMKDWSLIGHIATLGPGFFLRSHENTRYAWVDNAFSRDKDAIQIVDKETLAVVRTLRPEPGRTASHVEFSRDGRHALLSIAEPDGAVLVIDAETFVTVKRLPMRKPSGKYNIFNKITRSAGTSH